MKLIAFIAMLSLVVGGYVAGQAGARRVATTLRRCRASAGS